MHLCMLFERLYSLLNKYLHQLNHTHHIHQDTHQQLFHTLLNNYLTHLPHLMMIHPFQNSSQFLYTKANC